MSGGSSAKTVLLPSIMTRGKADCLSVLVKRMIAPTIKPEGMESTLVMIQPTVWLIIKVIMQLIVKMIM